VTLLAVGFRMVYVERDGLGGSFARGTAELSLWGDGKRLRDQSMEVGFSDESFQIVRWSDRSSRFWAG
jgi:hypothetical protein